MNETKLRYSSQRFPVKFSKLKQYEYFSNITKQFDSTFMRAILPYCSQLITTKNLQIQKFIYILISTPNSQLKCKTGYPIIFDQISQSQTEYQLQNQATFIKISLRTHIIFQKLININMQTLNLHNVSYKDKFWLFSEGQLKFLHFNQIAYKAQNRQSDEQKGIYIFLEGQFKCINKYGKVFKTIGQGFCLTINNSLAHISGKKLQQKIKGQNKIQQIFANCNNAKVLFLNKTLIRKYFTDINLQENIPIKKATYLPDKQNVNPFQLNKHKRFSTQSKQILKLKDFKKHARVSTKQNLTNEKPKFKLISNRQYKSNHQTKSIQQITSDQIVKQYIKDHFTYKNLPQIRKNLVQNVYPIPNKNKSNRIKSIQTNFMSSFFNKERESRKKVSNFSQLNQFCQTLKTLKQIESPQKKKCLIDEKLLQKRRSNLEKSELKAMGLLKRNILNKIYHQAHQK